MSGAAARRGWPRSLFYRNLLLFAGLMLLGQLATALLFRQLVIKPRVESTARAVAQELQALADGLAGLPAEQRAGFVSRFNSAHAANAESPDGTLPPRLTRLERHFLDQVRTELAPRPAAGGQVPAWHWGPGPRLEMTLHVDGRPYAVAMPGLRSPREFTGAWAAASGATALLAILGTWLIQRRLNRPLAALVSAAQALSRGERPPPLAEDGPDEIATVSRSFNDMAAGLARTEQDRALMLAGVSHDLRTPLAKMRLATEMLQGRADAELLATLDGNIEGMDRLLAQFLAFTRAGQGADEALVDADLNAVVRQALALCSDDGIALALGVVRPRPLPAQAVGRLLMNLVTNAQRHGAPPVEVATGEDAAGLWLEVRDRGPGIAADQVEALKKPFARGEAARSGPAGAGLGLAIVERIAQAHGARFELRSRPGGGLVARVAWPAG